MGKRWCLDNVRHSLSHWSLPQPKLCLKIVRKREKPVSCNIFVQEEKKGLADHSSLACHCSAASKFAGWVSYLHDFWYYSYLLNLFWSFNTRFFYIKKVRVVILFTDTSFTNFVAKKNIPSSQNMCNDIKLVAVMSQLGACFSDLLNPNSCILVCAIFFWELFCADTD